MLAQSDSSSCEAQASQSSKVKSYTISKSASVARRPSFLFFLVF